MCLQFVSKSGPVLRMSIGSQFQTLGTATLNAVLCLVSTILLPFFRSVATVAVAGEKGNAGNVFTYRPTGT